LEAIFPILLHDLIQEIMAAYFYTSLRFIMRMITCLFALLLILNSCAPVVTGDPKLQKRPPGQVKKVMGSQSAKPYAPGTQKKGRH